MTTQELAEKYPQKSFSQKFEEKRVALVGIGVPEEQLKDKAATYQKIFYYDELVNQIFQKLTASKSEPPQRSAELISFHFTIISELCSFLDLLNLSNTTDVNQIFSQFEENLKARGLLGSIRYQIDGRDINTQRSLVDEYIKETANVLKEFESLDFDPEKIKTIQKVTDNLIKNQKRYEDAAKTAENWIQAEGKALAAAVKDKAIVFNNKADKEHSYVNFRPWLIASIISGFVVLAIVGFFIYELRGNGNISVGTALLRISTLIVVSYFTFLFSQQFLTHRKLYESYKFKAIALYTMEELLKTYTDQKDRELILNKAISIIFSEPVIKEERIAQQKVIGEMFDIVKRKI